MGETRVTKNASGGRYKYADMSQIHGWLEDNNITYYQYTERIEGDDYIYTVPIIDGKELPPRRGCRIVDATLVGVNNPAQVQGSAITYARRYSLLMAFGLATEDDDAQSLTKKQEPKKEAPKQEPKKEVEQQVFPSKDITISDSESKALDDLFNELGFETPESRDKYLPEGRKSLDLLTQSDYQILYDWLTKKKKAKEAIDKAAQKE
jgi:hypothetical protein